MLVFISNLNKATGELIMKKEYDVCEGFTIELLNKEVNEALNDGWECQGGVDVTHFVDLENKDVDFENLIFHQAIVREVEDDQNKEAQVK
jgi:hypothetical protein